MGVAGKQVAIVVEFMEPILIVVEFSIAFLVAFLELP